MTDGEKWIRLLRAYGPVPEGDAQEAEHVGRVAARLKIEPLRFVHPAQKALFDCFPVDTGAFKSVVLTGNAGEGKTSLCYQLATHLMGGATVRTESCIEDLVVSTEAGTRKVTMVFDLTAWRSRDEHGFLKPENVAKLEEFARSVHAPDNHFFVLAVNDGQIHETMRALPSGCSAELRALFEGLVALHAADEAETPSLRVRLINLSRIPSDHLMQLCLGTLLGRPEWACIDTEKTNPLFGENSPIPVNYALLKTAVVQARLLTLARIADATGHHLPLRSILILLSNALLGHPDAPDGVLRPGVTADRALVKGSRHRAALHRNLFGWNLPEGQRERRDVYRFLSLLHVGEETTNDLDELIIFGARDETLQEEYKRVMENDPFQQRDPGFDSQVRQYVLGLPGEEEAVRFLEQLAHERRRIFLHTDDESVPSLKLGLWATTVFHHAGDYISHILDPIRAGRAPKDHYIWRLAGGLNRVWTGLLLNDTAHKIHLASGLDLSTAAVSDLLIETIRITESPPGFSVEGRGSSPKAIIRYKDRKFSFDLTLPRFEFLMRVAAGTMPSSFSRESYEDFLSLKQCCLRDLAIPSDPKYLRFLDVTPTGEIREDTILLVLQEEGCGTDSIGQTNKDGPRDMSYLDMVQRERTLTPDAGIYGEPMPRQLP